MNYKIFFSLMVILFQGINLYCQTIEYTYDANGNRISRSILIEELKSQSFSFPVINPKSLQTFEKAMKAEEITSEEGEPEAIVYPNPSKGLINIEITNMPFESQNEMKLYDLSGTELIIKKDFGSYSEMDINRFKDGIYILQIRINEKIFDFKVIKN